MNAMFKEQYEKLVAKFGKTKVMIGGVVIALLLIGWLSGSANRMGGRVDNRIVEKAIENATGGKVKVDGNGNDVTVKTEQGTWSTSDKLPAGFPTDVPVYPNAKVQGSVASAGQDGSGNYVGLQTTDALADVIAWYKKEIVAKGWTVTTDAMVNGSLMMSATKDSRALSATVTGEDGTVTIALVVARQ